MKHPQASILYHACFPEPLYAVLKCNAMQPTKRQFDFEMERKGREERESQREREEREPTREREPKRETRA